MSWYLVVIDSRKRFADHAWRYVSRSIGFGVVEQVAVTSSSYSIENELTTDDGEGSFYWIAADSFCIERLGNLIAYLAKERDDARLFALVDRDGEQGTKYNYDEVYGKLRGYIKDSERIYVTSTRRVGGRGHELLRPKTRRTLHELRSKLYCETEAKPQPIPGEQHLLVTGAGFEFKDVSSSNIGLPTTQHILLEMGSPFIYRPEGASNLTGNDLVELTCSYRGKNESSYPVPKRSGVWRSGRSWSQLRSYAMNRQLDEYWDLLLEEEMWHRVSRRVRGGATTNRSQAKALFADREARMREAFRQSILKYDWGHLKQSLFAARQHWLVWLTTNYTQFANRAIALTGSGDTPPRRWRIVSSAAEARVVSQEAKEARLNRPLEQYLFKLHGDIGDLHTMAIAGHDKDHFSPLSVKVESLGQVYEAAERFLTLTLLRPDTADQKVTKVIWHIVGHSLVDVRLRDLIRNVCRATPDLAHHFVVVSRGTNWNGEIERYLEEDIGPKSKKKVGGGARAYLAKVARYGLDAWKRL